MAADDDQLSLLDLVECDTPRCRTCGRPAIRRRRSQLYTLFCGPDRCTNRDRVCKWCNKKFTLGTHGAGTKYCSRKCQIQGCNLRTENPVPCAWCGKISRGITRRWNERYLWPYICTPCLEPIKHVVQTLKLHRVAVERARQLVTDPGCEICGVNLLERIRTKGNQLRSRLAVDHDHACCSAVRSSCGKCVRGLICGPCNTSAGLMRDDPERVRSLASYLDRWHQREAD